MSKHTLIRRAVLEKLESVTGAPVTLFDGLPAFVEQEDLPAIAVWLTDAQYTGLMTDEDDWQATLHTAVFLSAQAPDTELDIWMEEKIFPALEEVRPDRKNWLSCLTPAKFAPSVSGILTGRLMCSAAG